MEPMMEKPETCATRAGSRLSASAVVSMTSVLGVWAAGAAPARGVPARGTSIRMNARTVRAGSCMSPPPGGRAYEPLQEFAANLCTGYACETRALLSIPPHAKREPFPPLRSDRAARATRAAALGGRPVLPAAPGPGGHRRADWQLGVQGVAPAGRSPPPGHRDHPRRALAGGRLGARVRAGQGARAAGRVRCSGAG